jgi:hypothetical protein
LRVAQLQFPQRQVVGEGAAQAAQDHVARGQPRRQPLDRDATTGAVARKPDAKHQRDEQHAEAARNPCRPEQAAAHQNAWPKPT